METPPPTGFTLNVPDAPFDSVQDNGVTFERGDRLRVGARAGTVKPDECGHPWELELDEGHIGEVLGGMRPAIAVVQWDAQRWQEVIEGARGSHVDLPSFASSIHVCYLERE